MLDTNIFISMIFFPSEQTRILSKRLAENHQIIICDYVIEEIRLVVERKFPTKREAIDRFFVELPYEMVYTPKLFGQDNLPQIRDPKVLLIIATAIVEDVDVFLTGDKDFLVLEVDSPEILTMTEVLEKY